MLPLVMVPEKGRWLNVYLCVLHYAAMGAVLWSFPWPWGGWVAIALAIYLRSQLARVKSLTGCERLELQSPNRVLLRRRGGATEKTELLEIRVLGPLLFLRLNRHASPAWMLVHADRQAPGMWHRARLLAREGVKPAWPRHGHAWRDRKQNNRLRSV